MYDREAFEGVDIGFALLPAHEGLGYAFEAADRGKQAALEEFKVSALSGITRKSNIGSQKLLQKLGMTFAGFVELPNQTKPNRRNDVIQIFLIKIITHARIIHYRILYSSR